MKILLNKPIKILALCAILILLVSIPVYYFIVEQILPQESHETILAITAVSALFSFILLVCLILLNRKISRNLWSPFYETLQKIRNFDLNSRKNLTFSKTDISEFTEMNKSIHKLIDVKIAAYSQQKEFIENASHELQTPLVLLQSKLDMMLQNPALSPDISNLIGEMNTALSRVTRVNKNLLMLAKIENHQFQRREKIFLSSHIEDILELLTDFIQSKNLSIETEMDPLIQVEGDMVLIDILITNLIMNAIRHTAKNGHFTVRLLKNKLCISNTGTSALQEEKLFKRFSSASGQTPGSGLGLAIVAEIARTYHWEVSYDYQDQMHHFTIHL